MSFIGMFSPFVLPLLYIGLSIAHHAGARQIEIIDHGRRK